MQRLAPALQGTKTYYYDPRERNSMLIRTQYWEKTDAEEAL
ncbi:MAG: hypothetical protein AVDCRST_MAG28-1150 [uncultured Rubrobacteraceae bacterium]|uniref:Uncharacterized protein n=1 Tax=uncultured Rubrobacteraceae bacterium TaxID=349277 RepID=A0A6J4QM06_9ACTN|nr:MAG: hypothetical protein AVDCRST_MAG28-1150 [uncultured Rubrobacteraceae bacterium]